MINWTSKILYTVASTTRPKCLTDSKDDHQPAQAARTQDTIARMNAHSNRLITVKLYNIASSI